MRVVSWLRLEIAQQQGHLLPWAPVLFAIGIGGYFGQRSEPPVALLLICAALGAGGAVLARWRAQRLAPLVFALALMLAGYGAAGLRANMLAAPVLPGRYYGPVEGRVIAMDRASSGYIRLTLDRVRLARYAPARTPRRVRVTLLGRTGIDGIGPGSQVMTTAHLSAPQGPVEPGGFDFRRHAWFARLGGLGYARVPVLLTGADAGENLLREQVRNRVSGRIGDLLPGDVGGVAAAVVTGQRGGIGPQTLAALRASNLAHLLAISGLHMGLLAGVVFAALRFLMACWPAFALRVPIKKIAAGGALVAAAGYLAISGGNVATERAFIMAAVALMAVIFDRRALSIRAVAVAALIVLGLRPEALTGPGFQMSFAATTALVIGFGAMRSGPASPVPKPLRPVVAVILSSMIAGAATAPVAAAHFNFFSRFGLVANLLSVPVMGAVVAPAAVASGVLSLVGLEEAGLRIMGLGLRWILGVAAEVSSWPGARLPVAGPPGMVLPVLALGCLWALLWQGWLRLAGLIPVAAAVALWVHSERPDILIDGQGGLIGVMTADGRALSKPRGAGFAARIWLENDGDMAGRAAASARWPVAASPLVRYPWAGGELLHITGKRALAQFSGCAPGDIVVAPMALKTEVECRLYDLDTLRRTGSVAIHDGKYRHANTLAGARLWTRRGRNKTVPRRK